MRSARWSRSVAAGICMLVAASGARSVEDAPTGARPVLLIPLPKAPSWKDYAYLAAVPAAAKAGGGRPVVIALDECATVRPEAADFLRRFDPTSIHMLDCAVRPAPTEEGVVAYWPLNEGVGPRCMDRAGGEGGPAPRGGPTLVPVSPGRLRRLPEWEVEHKGGLRFDGMTFTVEHGSVPGSAKELTVAFWMKADKVGRARPIGKYDNSHKAPGWIVMLRTEKEKSSLRFRVGGGGGAWGQSDVASQNAYKAGEWVHVACTHAGGTSRIYLDGKLAVTREKIAWSTPNNTNSPLAIGTPGRGERFVGMLDEVRIYHRALGRDEVERLADAADAPRKGLVAHWRLDEPDARLARDSAGGHNAAVRKDPKWEEGRVGGGMRLRGNGDGLEYAPTLGSAKPFSVAFRLKAREAPAACVLRKAGTGDGAPPWSFLVEKATGGRAFVFRVGSGRGGKGEGDLRIAKGFGTREWVHVVATFGSGEQTMYLDGRRIGSREGVAWRPGPPSADAVGVPGECVDDVRIYDRALTASEAGRLAATRWGRAAPEVRGLVGSWWLNKEALRAAHKGPAWSAGRAGGGLLFDGSHDYVDCGAKPGSGEKLTVAFWMKAEGPGCPVAKSAGSDKTPGWCVLLEGKETRYALRFRVGGAAGTRAKGDLAHGESYRPGEWVHVGCTFADGTSTLYLDGRPADTLRRIAGPGVRGSAAPLILGALRPGRKHFKGELDEVRIYDRALDEEEMLVLFASGPKLHELGKALKRLSARTADDAGVSLARAFWKAADRIVCCSSDDYASALVASGLAGRLRAPLFFFGQDGLSREAIAAVAELGAKEALVVGEGEAVSRRLRGRGVAVRTLASAHKALGWMKVNRIPVEYIAAANPRDREIGHVKKLSLAAPLLAAGREGAVVPLDFDTQWKVSFAASRTSKTQVPGAPPSKGGWRTGKLELEGSSYPFVVTSGKGKTYFQANIDRAGDGDFGSEGDGPFQTGDAVRLAGRQYVVTVGGRRNGVGKADLRLTWPGADEVQEELARHYEALGRHPEYLCIVGRPDAIPIAIIRNRDGDPGDVPSDLPFAQGDADPFLEIAVGRLIGEDAWGGTLVASRSLAYDELIDPSWTARCATAAWESFMAETFENVGYGKTVHHGGKPIDHTSPLTRVVAISHMQHSWYRGLGEFVEWETKVLLAPCVIESSGCLTTALDLDENHRSAPARLLRNGAVTFAGNVRPGIAHQAHYRTEFWNALTSGRSVGQAHRFALNRARLTVLEKSQTRSGSERFQLYNRSLFADPAVGLHVPAGPRVRAARLEGEGSVVTVRAPSKWWRYDQHIPKDWKYDKSPKLYAYRGSGVGTETHWFGPDRYDIDAFYYTAEFRTRRRVTKVEQLDDPPEPLGWTGRFWTDEHQDGTRSVYWRVRMLDVDMPKGVILKQVDKIRFRLTFSR